VKLYRFSVLAEEIHLAVSSAAAAKMYSIQAKNCHGDTEKAKSLVDKVNLHTKLHVLLANQKSTCQ
jgi:hypothetical protein